MNLNYRLYLTKLSAALVTALFCSSCFTGIESTPRISSDDVRRQRVSSTPEQLFLSDIRPQSPSQWQPGKRFYVADDKISIIFAAGAGTDRPLSGTDIVFERFEQVPSVTGQGATELVFRISGDVSGKLLKYPVAADLKSLESRERLEVPFTIERSVVDSVDRVMRGNSYYISTPKWYAAADGRETVGRRHIPVRIDSVSTGTYIYPLRVWFTPSDDTAKTFYIPMTIGTDRAATRNFDAVFHFDNPRLRYPRITDDVWELIINSRVRDGMTRDECRLALGAPDSYRTIPVTNAVVEQWSYADGVYLIFEDGLLTRYRI